jgi:HK97 family phage prohead protease
MTIHKVFKAAATELGPRQVRVRCSSADVDRSGEIVVQAGIKFADSIPVLFQHDPAQIVGRAKPIFVGADLYADVEFAPEGISTKADEICGLAKHGVIDTVSIGFDPIDCEPMDPKKPRGAQKYLSCELLELSFVSVPANPRAEVVLRAKGAGDAQEIDPMPQTVTKEARAAAVSKMHDHLRKKGLWEIGYFAELLGCLGWLRDNAEWEALLEGEASQVAELIAEALRAAADAFLAMTAEEVAELLGDEDEDDVVDVLDTMDAGTAEVVMSGKTIAVRKFRAARAVLKQIANPVKKAAGPLDPAHTKCLKTALVQHQARTSRCCSAASPR